MNLATTKIELARQILRSRNKALINQIKLLFETEHIDPWDEMPDEIKRRVERSIKQANEGKLTSHKEVMKNIRKWAKK